MKNNIIVINGPNLNLLGEREQSQYGSITYKDLKNKCIKHSKDIGINIDFAQSNIEGEIVTLIQQAKEKFDGLIINAAGFTHTSVAILDSLRAIDIPKIEIHLSNIYTREEYRKKSITSEGVNGLICGFGELSYILAIEAINKLIYK